MRQKKPQTNSNKAFILFRSFKKLVHTPAILCLDQNNPARIVFLKKYTKGMHFNFIFDAP